jgi:hypothetical protein
MSPPDWTDKKTESPQDTYLPGQTPTIRAGPTPLCQENPHPYSHPRTRRCTLPSSPRCYGGIHVRHRPPNRNRLPHRCRGVPAGRSVADNEQIHSAVSGGAALGKGAEQDDYSTNRQFLFQLRNRPPDGGNQSLSAVRRLVSTYVVTLSPHAAAQQLC